MLTYAFDLLYTIYEEQGYGAAEIPSLILTHNLYGIEIDERAGELAAFALTMKARDRHRRFFNTDVRPNICVLEPISFDDDELDEYIDFIGRDLFTTDLEKTLRQFDEVDNFGSLIRPELKDVTEILEQLDATDVSGQLFLGNTHQKVLKLLKQASYLSPKYHVVVANPPYMGSGGMNSRLKSWVGKNYPNSKSDLFAMFIERSLDFVQSQGLVAMITMQSWMFLSSYNKLRESLLESCTILSMAHLGARAFDSISGEVVQTTAFIIGNFANKSIKADYLRLTEGNSEHEKKASLFTIKDLEQHDLHFKKCSADFIKIPGYPIAYWTSETVLDLFESSANLESISKPRQGATTSDNNRFLRFWHEIASEKFGLDYCSLSDTEKSNHKWFPYNKGGGFRRWYGNQAYAINYAKNGQEIKEFHEELNKKSPGGRLKNQSYYLKPNVSWSKISSGTFAARFFPKGFIFDVAGSAIFFKDSSTSYFYNGLLNSTVVKIILEALSPTLNFEAEHLCKIPIVDERNNKVKVVGGVEQLIKVSTKDWDSYEDSWDFTNLPLLDKQHRKPALKDTYQQLRKNWQQMTDDMKRLEEENNRIFIDAYGLQDELTPEVPLREVTLTCNPYYRYGGDKTAEELETLLLADTMRELISYAVGCMFGRYSLDKPG